MTLLNPTSWSSLNASYSFCGRFKLAAKKKKEQAGNRAKAGQRKTLSNREIEQRSLKAESRAYLNAEGM